ncbi:unnamed protein product [Urochloa humidicola]
MKIHGGGRPWLAGVASSFRRGASDRHGRPSILLDLSQIKATKHQFCTTLSTTPRRLLPKRSSRDQHYLSLLDGEADPKSSCSVVGGRYR